MVEDEQYPHKTKVPLVGPLSKRIEGQRSEGKVLSNKESKGQKGLLGVDLGAGSELVCEAALEGSTLQANLATLVVEVECKNNFNENSGAGVLGREGKLEVPLVEGGPVYAAQQVEEVGGLVSRPFG